MTDNNATLATEELRPVSCYENEKVKGMALSCDSVHEMSMARVEELRKRQRDYLESLPSDPNEGLSAIAKLIGDDMDEGLERAQHAMILVEEVIRHAEIDGYPDLQNALAWAAMEAADEVRAFRAKRRKAQDICYKVRTAA